MKITNQQLKQIIREELRNVLGGLILEGFEKGSWAMGVAGKEVPGKVEMRQKLILQSLGDKARIWKLRETPEGDDLFATLEPGKFVNTNLDTVKPWINSQNAVGGTGSAFYLSPEELTAIGISI